MIWELIWVDIPKWPVRKRMMKEMAIMIKTISTWTETFQAAFQVAPMPFVIGTLFMLLMWKIRMRVVQCTTMHTMCILLPTRVSSQRKVVEKTAAQPAP